MKSFIVSFLVLVVVCACAEGFDTNYQQGQYDAYEPTYFRWPQTNFMKPSRTEVRRDGSRRFNDKSNAVAFTPNLQHVGGIPYLSEFSEEKHQAFSSQIPGYYPQQQVSFYTSYQPIIERDSLNPVLDGYTNAENSIESTTQLNDESYDISTEKNTDEAFETTQTGESSTETTTDFSETSTFEENFSEDLITNTEINKDETSTSSTSESNNIDSSTPGLTKYCWLPRGQFPSMTSCKNFINCWDGAAIEQECGPGTLFNDQTGYCDYPEAVVCGSRPLYSSDDGLSNDCSVDYTTFRNPSNCSEYFVCVNHKPKLFTCGVNLYYNLKLRVCDYKYNVYCETRQRFRREDLEEVAQVTESISVSEVKPSEKPSDPSEINLHDVATIF